MIEVFTLEMSQKIIKGYAGIDQPATWHAGGGYHLRGPDLRQLTDKTVKHIAGGDHT